MGQRIRSKAVLHGYHWDKTAWRDNMYVRCSRCGFINNLDRDLRSHPGGREGWGYADGVGVQITVPGYDPQHPQGPGTYNSSQSYDSSAPYDSPATPSETIYDPITDAGCCQCGTLLYNNPAHWTKG